MFRAVPCSSSRGQIILLQPLVSSLSVKGRTICRLRADCSKYVEDDNVIYIYCYRIKEVCIKLVTWNKKMLNFGYLQKRSHNINKVGKGRDSLHCKIRSYFIYSIEDYVLLLFILWHFNTQTIYTYSKIIFQKGLFDEWASVFVWRRFNTSFMVTYL